MQPHMQLDPLYSLFHSTPKYSPREHGRILKTRAPENAFRALSPIQKCPQRKALGTTELPRGAFRQPHMQLDPLYSLFHSNPEYNPGPHGRRLKNRASENALQTHSPIQKCPQRKALGTSELPRGAFMQPHMQLDPPGSLFPSNTMYTQSRLGRRLKTRAPENAF